MSNIDAKSDAAEARKEKIFSEMLGELKAMNNRVDNIISSTSWVKATVVAAGIGGIALAIALSLYFNR